MVACKVKPRMGRKCSRSYVAALKVVGPAGWGAHSEAPENYCFFSVFVNAIKRQRIPLNFRAQSGPVFVGKIGGCETEYPKIERGKYGHLPNLISSVSSHTASPLFHPLDHLGSLQVVVLFVLLDGFSPIETNPSVGVSPGFLYKSVHPSCNNEREHFLDHHGSKFTYLITFNAIEELFLGRSAR